MIRNLIPRLGRMAASAPTARRQQQGETRSLLLIDDQAESLRALATALADPGLRIESADSAESALQKLAGRTPDLIVLNPGVRATNGTRLARRLLAEQTLSAVPIVATRDGASPAEGAQSDDCFDARLSRTASPQSLRHRLQVIFEACRVPAAQRHLDLPLPDLIPGDRMKQADRLLHAIELKLPESQFDAAAQEALSRLAEAVEGAGELSHHLGQALRFAGAATARARQQFRSLLRYCRDLALREDPVPGFAELRVSYLERRRGEMDDLDRALAGGDYPALRKWGHNLKGMGAAYGFAELTELGRTLELAGKDLDGPLAEAALDRIEAYLTVVEPSAEEGGEYAAGK